MADGAPHFEESGMPELDPEAWDALVAEHETETELTPGKRRELDQRLARVQGKETAQANARALLRLKDDDRSLLERAVKYWGHALKLAKRPDIDPLVRQVWEGGVQRDAERSALKRFKSYDVDPSRTVELKADHLALEAGVSIFPSTVKGPWESPRLLVSGHNNRKLGAKVEKGAWKDMPIYHLTLEERASCPRSCAMWAGCYGNSLHMARRHNHLHEDFLDLLRAEVWMLAREHRHTGFVVRLHTLGDFFSVEYVRFWAELIDRLPMLHVFGYTANLPGAADPTESAIGSAIEKVAAAAWDQFAIRFSNYRGPQGTVVIDDVRDAPEAIPCPAQHTAAEADAKTEACAACGLCWSENARDKTIAFLRHGMKARGAAA